jgi:hypothetical protein
MSEYVSDSCLESMMLMRLTELKFPDGNSELSEIDIGGKVVVIKFATGKYVSFNSSEWGSISSVSDFREMLNVQNLWFRRYW